MMFSISQTQELQIENHGVVIFFVEKIFFFQKGAFVFLIDGLFSNITALCCFRSVVWKGRFANWRRVFDVVVLVSHFSVCPLVLIFINYNISFDGVWYCYWLIFRKGTKNRKQRQRKSKWRWSTNINKMMKNKTITTTSNIDVLLFIVYFLLIVWEWRPTSYKLAFR